MKVNEFWKKMQNEYNETRDYRRLPLFQTHETLSLNRADSENDGKGGSSRADKSLTEGGSSAGDIAQSEYDIESEDQKSLSPEVPLMDMFHSRTEDLVEAEEDEDVSQEAAKSPEAIVDEEVESSYPEESDITGRRVIQFHSYVHCLSDEDVDGLDGTSEEGQMAEPDNTAEEIVAPVLYSSETSHNYSLMMLMEYSSD